MAIKIAWEFPIFLPIKAENREKVAKVSKGRVVKKPAQPLLSPKSSLIIGINGPTAVIEGRRLNETKRIPRKRTQVFWYKGCLDDMILKTWFIDQGSSCIWA